VGDPIPVELFLADFPEPIQELAAALRVVVREALPEVIERVRPGWRIIGYDVPLGRRSSYFAWIMAESVHVHLGFRFGVLMDDPAGLLGGDAKLGRWTTWRPGDVVDVDALRPLVLEGARVGRLRSSERKLLLLDRELAPDRLPVSVGTGLMSSEVLYLAPDGTRVGGITGGGPLP
jgi:hypothetical protein